MFGGFPGQNYFLKGELVLCSRNSYSYHWLPAHSIACPDVTMGFSLSKTSCLWKSVKHIKKVQCGLLQMKTYQGSIWLIKTSDFKLTTDRTNHLRIVSNSNSKEFPISTFNLTNLWFKTPSMNRSSSSASSACSLGFCTTRSLCESFGDWEVHGSSSCSPFQVSFPLKGVPHGVNTKHRSIPGLEPWWLLVKRHGSKVGVVAQPMN